LLEGLPTGDVRCRERRCDHSARSWHLRWEFRDPGRRSFDPGSVVHPRSSAFDHRGRCIDSGRRRTAFAGCA
jgi:hypothetical protein